MQITITGAYSIDEAIQMLKDEKAAGIEREIAQAEDGEMIYSNINQITIEK